MWQKTSDLSVGLLRSLDIKLGHDVVVNMGRSSHRRAGSSKPVLVARSLIERVSNLVPTVISCADINVFEDWKGFEGFDKAV